MSQDVINTSGTGTALREKVQSLKLPRQNRRSAGSAGFAWFLVLILLGSTSFLGYREWERMQGSVSETPSASANASAAGTGNNVSPASNSTNPTTANSANISDAEKPLGSIMLESKGYIVPKHLILVTPKVSGMIQTLYVEEGMIIKKGAPLADLEADEYRFERDRSRANYQMSVAKFNEMSAGYEQEEKEEALADEDEARAQVKQLELSYQRLLQLRKSNSASSSELEQAEFSWRAMAARVRRLENRSKLVKRGYRQEKISAAKSEVDQARAELDRAEWRLANCAIRSPITGIVLSKKSEQGNVVNPIAFSGSTAICEIADLGDLEVDLSVQERDFARVYDGQPCKIRLEAWPDREYKGIARRMPTADRSKGVVPVRVKVEVPPNEIGEYLRPEMGAVVAFLKGKNK